MTLNKNGEKRYKIKQSPEFYYLGNILKVPAKYRVLFSERTNGKSYAIKEFSLYCAYHGINPYTNEELGTRKKIAYVRRWERERSAAKVEKYFADMIVNSKGVEVIKEITGGEYTTISCYRDEIFLANIDEQGKKVRGMKIGDVFYLTGETHYKSLAYPDILNIVFEEFITDSLYLPNEVDTFESLISTILRRDNGYVWLLGNTINDICPYFDEWGLSNISKQKQGTIEVYERKSTQNGEEELIKIACEYCSKKNTSTMFFRKKSVAATHGTWECEEKPHLPIDFNTLKVYYKVYVFKSRFAFTINLVKFNNVPFLYIYPCTRELNIEKLIERGERVVTDLFILDTLVTQKLVSVTRYDEVVLDCIKMKRICYSDNMTGTRFERLLDV